MKKALFFGLVVGSIGFSSCSKLYTCTVEERDEKDKLISTTMNEYEGLSKDEVIDYERECLTKGGAWEIMK